MKRFLFAALLMLGLLPSIAEAANKYVSTAGDNGNAGTIGSPWLTLSFATASAQLSCGDTLWIRGGTYNGGFGIVTGSSNFCSSWGNPITVSAYTPDGGATYESVTLTNTSQSSVIGLFSGSTACAAGTTLNAYWQIKHLTLDGTGGANDSSIVNGNSVGFMRFDSVIANHAMNSGFFTSNCSEVYDVDGWELLNTECKNYSEESATATAHHCVYLSHMKNTLVDGGSYHDGEGYDMQLNCVNCIIRNAIFYNGDGMNVGNGSGSLVYNNIFHHNELVGLQINQSCVGCGAYNNVTINNPIGLWVFNGAINSIVRNNINWGNSSLNYVNDGTGTTADHNVTVDPLFKCYVGISCDHSLDYQLFNGSPAQTAGSNLGTIFTTDKAGLTRPNTPTAWSAGAYEYSGAVTETLASITGSPIGQGQTKTFVLTGGSTVWDVTSDVAISGTGLTRHSMSIDSATQITVNYTAASNATASTRTVTVTTTGHTPVTNSITVITTPILSEVRQNPTGQGSSDDITVINVNGTFASTSRCTASGTGVTFTAAFTAVSATTGACHYSIAADAATGLRNITVTTVADGALTLNNSFLIGAPSVLYVDADYDGVTRDGSAANPWRSLSDTVTNTPWTVINQALAAGDVTVYFSARAAGSDVADDQHHISLDRTDTSSNRLTLDGMTKWNTDDTNPSWMDYGGLSTRLTSKASVSADSGEGWSIGWGGGGIIPTMDNVTVRGFISTGDSARFRFEGGGSNFIVEYNYVHDVTARGPGMTFNSGAYAYSAGPTTINPSGVCTLRIGHLSYNVIFRYNVINNTADENLYFGGNGEDGSPAAHGFNCPGHTNIQFIGNTLSNPGQYGIGEGDCFDLKNGVTNVTYRGNIVGPCSRNGIPLMGAAISYRPQNMLVEQNIIHDTDTLLGGAGAINILNTWDTVPDTSHIQSNIIYNGHLLAYDGNSDTAGDGAKYSIYIDNNTVDNGLIVGKYIHTGSIRNNIALYGSSGAVQYAQVASFTDSNNAGYTSVQAGGTNNKDLSSGQVAALFTNRAAHDYTIASAASQAYHAGITISPAFADYNGDGRSVPLDMGAIAYTPYNCIPHHLTLTAQPSSAAIGVSIGTVTASIYDVSNVQCPLATNTITFSKHSGSCIGMALNGTQVADAVGGVLSETDLFMSVTTGSCLLDATASGLTTATSNPFTITAALVGGTGNGVKLKVKIR